MRAMPWRVWSGGVMAPEPVNALRPLSDWVQDQRDRPLGGVELTSGRTLSPFSQALWAGADNLLGKAAIALRQRDGERAERLVSRAASLPFDEHEESFPAALAVHLRLFSAVVEEMEESDVDDWGWLDAAVEILRTGDEYARADLRDVLVDIEND